MNKKEISKACSRLWSEIVLTLHPYCEVCNRPSQDPHHFFPKGMCSILKFVVDNGVGLCRNCHIAHHFRGDPKIHQTIIEKRGKEWYENLKKQSLVLHSSYKTKDWFQRSLEELNKIYKEI